MTLCWNLRARYGQIGTPYCPTVVREAFFPSGAPPRFVENAGPADFDKVMAITETHDGPDMVRIMTQWWLVGCGL